MKGNSSAVLAAILRNTIEASPEVVRALIASQQSEKSFQKQVIEVAHAFRWAVAAFRTARSSDGAWLTPVQAEGKGFPDLVLVRTGGGGGVLFRELKTNKGRLSAEQEHWQEWLTLAGADVGVWRPRDFQRILEELR